jgi:hypothetical protein
MTVHSVLMLVHSMTGPLPEFRPDHDMQRALTWLAGSQLHPLLGWLLLFLNGAVIWGFLFGQSYRFLPGERAWQKGLLFGLFAWLLMGLVFFPLVGRGVFAIRLGLGIAPAILLLVMLTAYSVTMSFVYAFLSSRHACRG